VTALASYTWLIDELGRKLWPMPDANAEVLGITGQ
jgi:hypothetical protein